MTQCAADVRALQEKLDQPVSAPSSPPMRPRSMHATGDHGVDVASNLVQNIQTLKAEVTRLQSQLSTAQTERECCSYNNNNNNYYYYYYVSPLLLLLHYGAACVCFKSDSSKYFFPRT